MPNTDTHTSYEILINEEQRKLIQDALFHYRGLPQPTKLLHDEVVVLHDLFMDLPNQDNIWVDPVDGKTKHMTHGFCL